LGFSYAYSGVSGFESAWADSVVGTVNVGIRPMALEFNPSNNNIYVANQGSNDISVIKTVGLESIGNK
jgi:DNA-binding beta-propeller fold protein YncE